MNAQEAQPNKYYWAFYKDHGWEIVYLHHKMNGRMLRTFAGQWESQELFKWDHLIEIEQPSLGFGDI